MNRRITLAVTAIAVALLVTTHGFAADHREGGGQVGAHFFPPTSLSAQLGYRVLVAYSDNADPGPEDTCHVSVQFFDSRGKLINEGRFHLAFGESRKLDLEPANNRANNELHLVRAVVKHEPMGCCSATSEVARIARDDDGGAINGDSCWNVEPGSIVPVRGAIAPAQ